MFNTGVAFGHYEEQIFLFFPWNGKSLIKLLRKTMRGYICSTAYTTVSRDGSKRLQSERLKLRSTQEGS